MKKMKYLAIENNNIKKTSEITDEDNNSVTSNTESASESQNELNINSKALYEESKKKLEPYQLKMIETIKNIENMVKTGERQRNYKIKSEFEREKEYKLEEQDEIKNKIIELNYFYSDFSIFHFFLLHFFPMKELLI